MSKESQKIKELEERLEKFEKSPLKKAYLSMLSTITRWFEQIEFSEIDITNNEHKQKFEMVHKFFTELIFYIETLEKIRAKMTPEEVKELEGGTVETILKELKNAAK
jgi:N-acetylglutamate synthase-like GNAT family acetyltransferase